MTPDQVERVEALDFEPVWLERGWRPETSATIRRCLIREGGRLSGSCRLVLEGGLVLEFCNDGRSNRLVATYRGRRVDHEP